MADPLSTTASIAAVVQLSSVIVKYINAAAGAAKERKLLRDGIRACEFALQQLKDDADDTEEGDAWSETIKVLEGPDGPLYRLSVTLNLVKLKLEPQKGFQEIVASMKWPFSAKEVQSLLSIIEREKSLLQLAMTNNSRKTLAEVKRLASENQKQLENLISFIDRSSSEQNGKISQFIADTTAAAERNQEKLANIQAGVEEMLDSEAAQERQRILDWLTPSDYAQQQIDFYSRRQEGTGERLLESEKFQKWLETKQQTLFCPGISGAGKTMQMSIVINHLSQRFKTSDEIGFAYVYCNFRRQNEQTAQDLCTKLLRQLVQSRPSLPQGLVLLHKLHTEKQTRPSAEEILEILRSVASSYSRVFIVVDALDECKATHECRTTFLTILFHVQVETGANILITSRPNLDIQGQFKDCPSLEILASDEDIRKYVAGNMSLLVPFVSDKPKLQKEIQIAIADAVEGMFLLAQLYLGSLDDKTSPRDIRSALEHFKKESSGSNEGRKLELLSKAYDEAMHRINGQKDGFQNLAKKVLAWITCARRPLTTSELQHALAVEIGDNGLDEESIHRIEDMVSVCAGLVTIDEESDIVRLVHYTTQEYFERTQQRWFPDSETEITEKCVAYLSFDVFESGPPRLTNEYDWRDYPLYQYAAENWVHHARNSSVLSETIFSFMESGARWRAATVELFRYRYMPSNLQGLHIAALFDAKNIAEELLKRGNVLEPRNDEGSTPLHIAAKEGCERVTRLLLEQGAHVNAMDNSHCTPLTLACIDPKPSKRGTIELLLEQRADMEVRNRNKFTPLMQACDMRAKDIVHLLLEKGANTGTFDKDRRTSLHIACENDSEEVVKLLLENGANINALDKLERTPFYIACRYGNLAVAQCMIERGADTNICDNEGQAPLHIACQMGREEVVLLLLSKSAAIRENDSNGHTPLHLTRLDQSQKFIRPFLNKDADVTICDIRGQTPLHFACEEGSLGIIQRLLDSGADLKAIDTRGQTPFHKACQRQDINVIQRLLDSGADLKTRDKQGHTPMSIACQSRSQFQTEEVVQLLLCHGAEVNTCDNEGQPLLHIACENLKREVIPLLVENGADIKACDKEGQTALRIACQSKKQDNSMVWLLLKNGADTKECNDRGETVLHTACQGLRYGLIQLLLDNGADLEACDNQGQTPLHVACHNGRKRIVRILLKNGADIKAYDNYEKTPLVVAMQNQRMAVVDLLLENGATMADVAE